VRHELGKGDSRLARVGMIEGTQRSEQRIDRRLRGDGRPPSHRRAQHDRGEGLGRRSSVVDKIATEPEEVLLEHELPLSRDQEGMDQGRAACIGIDVDQAPDQARQRVLAHPDLRGARGRPAVAGPGRSLIAVGGRARRPRAKGGGQGGVGPRQLDDAAEIGPSDPQARRVANHRAGQPDLRMRRVRARVEAQRVRVTGDPESCRPSDRVALGISKRGDERVVRPLRDRQVEGEAVLERHDRAMPRVRAVGPEGQRRAIRLPRVSEFAAWLDPESLDRLVTSDPCAAETAARPGERELDGISARLETHVDPRDRGLECSASRYDS